MPVYVEFDPQRLSTCRLFSRIAALVAISVGLVVLVGGWGFGIGALKDVLPGYSVMQPGTAFGILMMGAALLFDRAGQANAAGRTLAMICAGIGGLIGLLMLIGNMAGTHFIAAAQMPGTTAVSLLLLGGAMPLFRERRGFEIGQYMVLIGGSVSLFTVIGFLYGIKRVYVLAFHGEGTAMAIHTAVTLTILCAGALLSRPDWGIVSTITSQGPGGVMMRRLLPAALLFPVVATWLRAQAEAWGVYDTSFRITLYTSIYVVVFTLSIWRSSRTLNRLHNLRIVGERTLRESESQFKALLESAPDAVVIQDDQGRIILVNAQAEILFGYDRRELLGQKVEMLLPSHAGKPAEELHSVEFEGRRKDGTQFPAEVSKSPVETLQGTFVCKAIRDITKRKRVEQLIAERQRAEDANVAKSEFLAAMSHEIRTPMNAILGMADLLWESKLDAEQMQYVEVFRRAGSGLLVLINDILDLSKIESGHAELENVEFDLEEVVAQAIELTMVKARAKGILLLPRLVPGVATALMGDPTKLKQILINLLGNAVKFTESGGVVLTIQNCSSGKAGEIEFSISDSGIGISASSLETIFNDFTQGDSSTTRKYGGTGLGLGISRRLVESMNGRLTASSVPGEGSTFRFTAQFDLAAASHQKDPSELPDIHGRRVLVIDSDETSSLILRETLRAWGLASDAFAVLEAAIAVLAREMTGGNPYSLVFVDHCKHMDGFEAASRVKKVAPQVPVIMLTSDSRPGDAQRRQEAGLSGHAVKPIRRTDLLRLVSAVLKPGDGSGCHDLSGDKKTVATKAVKILVADDSSDNRLLVQVYLRGSPHLLTLAEDGKAAVDLFSREDFDLVLMDIQMPVMDGLTATRAIRAIERDRGAGSIPIIALTANARQQDVEMSHNAGCNCHITKPISKPKLLAVIEEYGAQRKPGEKAATPLLAAIVIKMPPGLEEIGPEYLAHRRAELPGMMELLQSSDFKTLAVLGHDLKGTGASYGFPDLTRLGSAIEHSAHEADMGALGVQLAELGEYLGQIELCAEV
jgi:PAS domain S-box-containing protein